MGCALVQRKGGWSLLRDPAGLGKGAGLAHVRAMIRILLFSLMALISLPAHAGDGRLGARLLPGWRMADGTHMAALELRLAPGWKTYWRHPGEAGLPPRFDWSGSDNVAGVEVLWPAPEMVEQGGTRLVVYSGRVLLPLRVTPRGAGPARLAGTATVGICREVCVPLVLRLGVALDAAGVAPDPRIATALERLPRRVASTARCTVRPAANGLDVVLDLPAAGLGGGETIFVDWPGPLRLSPTGRAGGRLTTRVTLHRQPGRSLSFNRKALSLTVAGPRGAVVMRGCQAG